VKYILTLALLMPGALSAMQSTELDLGSDTSYKELQVNAKLTQAPYGTQESRSSHETLRRFYTQSGSRLPHKLSHENGALSIGDYEANVNISQFYFPQQRTSIPKVLVAYKLTQASWLPILFPPNQLLFNFATLPLNGEGQKIEHKTENQELITLAIVAKWIEHKKE
jgi:hypothetical protein